MGAMTQDKPTTLWLLSISTLLASACGSKETAPIPPAAPLGGHSVQANLATTAIPEYDFENLVRAARADLEAYSGKDLADLGFELTSRNTMIDVLTRNLRAPMPQDHPLELNAALVQATAATLVAIYDFADTKKVYTCLQNLSSNAAQLGIPELKESDALYAILVHEGVRALIDRSQGLADFLAPALRQGEDAKMAADAMVAGYAQHVARKLCEQAGKLQGFEAFTRSLSTPPPTAEAKERAMWDLHTKQVSFSYVEGETFVASVLKELGPQGVDRIFQTPPTTRQEVANPDWYLHPETRPKTSVDWDPALELVPGFAGDFPDMNFQVRSLSSPEIEGALAILGPVEAKEVASLVLDSRMNIGMTPGGERLLVVGLFAMASETDARRYLELSRKANAQKDEAMKSQGVAELRTSKLVEVHAALGDGFETSKDVYFQGRELPLRTLLVARGTTVLEVTLSNAVLSDSAWMDLAHQVMDRAQGYTSPLK